ncbi:iron ABC transporter permease [Enterocloster lavalensis]|uniref:Iron complex transport system permease protein n=2 Tax=Lachnospiraceae TaxID=186803 RepID=A0A1I0IMQ8_9FIRM|nr:iron ABC transporter permease [Enterocloster lavalensis]SET98337.1 iron complex transport system permease protein [Enterocloster lavalensis]
MREEMDEMLEREGSRAWIRLLLLFLLLAVGFIMSLAVGRYYIPVSEIFTAFTGGQVPDKTGQVLMVVRLPRVLAAVLVGGAMSVSGTAYQGMFKNPLVSPDILGSSAGAGFGAALAILLSFGVAGTKGAAFFFGLFAVFITWLISHRFGKGDDSLFLLILGGIIVSNLFQSLISLVKYAADPTDKLPAITFWLMGSLSKAVMKDVQVMLVPFVLCTAVLVFCAGRLNILALGEEEARTLGINTGLLQVAVIVTATVLTAFCVSLCGMIGWVGLVIPHLARMMVGPNFKVLLPASLLLGSSYLLIMDDLCRSVFAVEIPLGIITSLAGLPFFLYLLTRQNKGW